MERPAAAGNGGNGSAGRTAGGKQTGREQERWNLFVIDPRSKAPIYEQLREQLRWQITMGFLAPEEPLPSVRTLSAELGINPNTIQKAYREMEQEGLIYSRPGRGSFVTPKTGEQRKRQQESQAALLEREIRKAKDMGISREDMAELVRKVYGGADET